MGCAVLLIMAEQVVPLTSGKKRRKPANQHHWRTLQQQRDVIQGLNQRNDSFVSRSVLSVFSCRQPLITFNCHYIVLCEVSLLSYNYKQSHPEEATHTPLFFWDFESQTCVILVNCYKIRLRFYA